MMGEGSFGYGIDRAIGEIIGGSVTSLIVDVFISSGLLPPAYAVLFSIVNMLGTIAFILAMPYWGTFYLLGWLVGLWIMSQAGMVGILDAAVYFGVPLVVLVMRFLKKLTD
jgi:hypothetical protein